MAAVKRSGPTRGREMAHLRAGLKIVAGVDEVGRGALAGPVVAAAVVLDPDRCPDGLDDSKRLTPAIRLRLFHEILGAAVAVSFYAVGPGQIDSINILEASREAMRRAVEALRIPPELALIDGLPTPRFPCSQEAIVGGDGLECCIAAASIVAKVTRDQLMGSYGALYPRYQFERHKGYATETHRAVIAALGPSPIHRMSFAPCSQYLPAGEARS
jgi:ribonuclease HII